MQASQQTLPLPYSHALSPNWRSPVAAVTVPMLTNGFLPEDLLLCWTGLPSYRAVLSHPRGRWKCQRVHSPHKSSSTSERWELVNQLSSSLISQQSYSEVCYTVSREFQQGSASVSQGDNLFINTSFNNFTPSPTSLPFTIVLLEVTFHANYLHSSKSNKDS